MTDLSVVVVNHNAGHWLRDCLDALGSHLPGVDAEIVVVDNGSRDGSLVGLEREFPHVRLIRNERNAGLARAVNQGIDATSGRYVLWLNPDALVLNDAMADWIAWMDAHPDVGISGPKVYDDDRRSSVQLSCRAFPSVWNALFSRHSPLTRLFPNNRFSKRFLMSDFDHDEIRDVDWVSGCCMLLRRSMLETVGGLDEGYPLFFEDVDVCYRAHQSGYRVVFHPTVEVAHYTGSLRAQAPLRTIVERHRSLWRFHRKFYRRSLRPLVSIPLFLAVYARMLFILALTILKRLAPLIVDVVAIQASAALAYLTRSLWVFPWFERAVGSYLEIAPWYTAMLLLLLYLFDLYHWPRSRYFDYLDVLPRVVKAATTGMVMMVFIAYFGRQFVLPRSIVLLSWIFNMVMLAGWRWIALYMQQRQRTAKRVLIYGTGSLAELVEEELRRRAALKCDPVGFICPNRASDEGAGVAAEPVLGRLDEIERVIHERDIDEVIFAAESYTAAELREVQRHCQSAHVDSRIGPELFELAMGTVHLEHVRGAVLDPDLLPTRNWYLNLKRLFDVGVAVVLLVVTAPIWMLSAVGVKLSSPGPFLFRQQRVGLGGRAFTLLKFRTMREGGGNTDGDDEDLARMTPFGRLLRLTRLDELPQLVNVLRGEMSLVGPRAEWTELARTMEAHVPHFEQRYLVRPGMTGWAQVEYKYTTSVNEYRKKIQYDLYYIKNLSFSLDLKILLKTIWVVLTGQGAR